MLLPPGQNTLSWTPKVFEVHLGMCLLCFLSSRTACKPTHWDISLFLNLNYRVETGKA